MIDDATIKRVAEEKIGHRLTYAKQLYADCTPDELVEFARAIEQLARAEQWEEAKDAKRYRALIASGKYCPSSIGGYWALVTCCAKPITKAEMDEAVDKAIRESGKENSNE